MIKERWQISRRGGRYFSKCLLNRTLSNFTHGLDSGNCHYGNPRLSLVSSLVEWVKISTHHKRVLRRFLPPNQGDMYLKALLAKLKENKVHKYDISSSQLVGSFVWNHCWDSLSWLTQTILCYLAESEKSIFHNPDTSCRSLLLLYSALHCELLYL